MPGFARVWPAWAPVGRPASRPRHLSDSRLASQLINLSPPTPVGAPEQGSHAHKRASTGSASGAAHSADADQQPERAGRTNQLEEASRQRGRIAGYLASKLSNLTGLSGQPGSATARSSSSAPPSPLNRARNQGAPSGGRWLNARANNQQRPSQVEPSRDHAGCDFMLVLEQAAKPGAAQSAAALVVHLVAPNTQEKAAWLSDISQVSRQVPVRVDPIMAIIGLLGAD